MSGKSAAASKRGGGGGGASGQAEVDANRRMMRQGPTDRATSGLSARRAGRWAGGQAGTYARSHACAAAKSSGVRVHKWRTLLHRNRHGGREGPSTIVLMLVLEEEGGEENYASGFSPAASEQTPR